MENTYYIGDLVFSKMTSAMTSIIYVFNGAEKTEDGWIVKFTCMLAQGYAGGGSEVSFKVKESDSLRLGSNCKARVKKPHKPDKLGSDKKVDRIYFDKIEKDLLVTSFDFI